MELSSGFATS